MRSEIGRWGPAIVLAGISLGVGAVELVLFPPSSTVGAEVVAEGAVVPLLISGLFLIAFYDFDRLVSRLLYAGTFILLLHAVTELADELVRPSLAFTIVVEHIGLVVGIGILFGALGMWAQSRQGREQELTDTRDRLLRTESLAAVGGWELDLTADELYWTNGTCRIHDLPTDFEPTLDEALSFYHPEDRSEITNLVQRCSDDGDPFQTELRIITATDQVRWVRVSGEAITEDGEIVTLRGAIRDITAEKERAQQLNVLNRILRHNLRNDLNVIRSRAEMLMNEFSQPEYSANEDQSDEPNTEPSLARTTVEHIEEHAQSIIEKTDELVSVAEKNRRYNDLTTTAESATATQLRPLLEKVCANRTAGHPDATIQLDCPASVSVLSSSAHLRAALGELVENSIHHSDTDESTVTITAESPEEGQVDIHIRDRGPGMPVHERSVLESQGETDLNHGSGIGLWIVNWLITRQGGSVSITESDGCGTVVTIRLPAASAAETATIGEAGTA